MCLCIGICGFRVKLFFMSNSDLIALIEREIEERAASRAAQMFEEYKVRQGAPEMPVDIAPNGKIIRPFLLGGVKYLNRKDAAALLGISLTVLWRITDKDKLLQKKKLAQKVYFLYDDVVNLINQQKGGIS